jgi:hypothetical protein
MAGIGKSTIAHTIACDYFEKGRLAASFFFSRGGGDVGNASKFVTTIAIQLAIHIPPVQRYISDVLTEHNIITSQSLTDQWRQLVLRPLSKLDDSDTYQSYVVIIDALDECEGENNIRIILRLLAEARSLKKVRLRVLVISRPEIPIRYGFCQIPDTEHRNFILHNIEAAIVDHDIFIFLHHIMGSIGQEWALGTGWPGEQALKQLVLNASGLFIWAATACRFIREGRRFAADRLSRILIDNSANESVTHDSSTDDNSVNDPAAAPDKHLNKLYITVLQNSARNYKKKERNGISYWEKLLELLPSCILLCPSLL